MEPISTRKSHKSEPPHVPKSQSRQTQMINSDIGSENEPKTPTYSVEYAPSPTKRKTTLVSNSNPSKLSIRPRNSVPIHDLLLFSPSPVRKSRTRLDIVDDQGRNRRRCKNRASGGGGGGLGWFSPRNGRRSRRRSVECDERELGQVDEVVVKTRKRRTSGRGKNDKISGIVQIKEKSAEENALENVSLLIWDLIMWRDVSKSSLWFGFGCLCFLSSCFVKGLNISFFSVVSQLGLLFLAASFISNTLAQRESGCRNHEVKLEEDDIMRLIRVVLPALNLVLSKIKELFSGEPSTTLKVATFLLFGSEYGHLLTLWRVFALGFFVSFTGPKVYSSYSSQIHSRVERIKCKVLETWRGCSHKKIVAVSAATAFWNLSSLKTRVFAAFISLVILRHYRQISESQSDKDEIVTAP